MHSSTHCSNGQFPGAVSEQVVLAEKRYKKEQATAHEDVGGKGECKDSVSSLGHLVRGEGNDIRVNIGMSVKRKESVWTLLRFLEAQLVGSILNHGIHTAIQGLRCRPLTPRH